MSSSRNSSERYLGLPPITYVPYECCKPCTCCLSILPGLSEDDQASFRRQRAEISFILNPTSDRRATSFPSFFFRRTTRPPCFSVRRAIQSGQKGGIRNLLGSITIIGSPTCLLPKAPSVAREYCTGFLFSRKNSSACLALIPLSVEPVPPQYGFLASCGVYRY